MKNTFIPLSIAYANSDGMILNISEMSPLALDRVLSSGPAKYALEMPAGWFKENNIFFDSMNFDRNSSLYAKRDNPFSRSNSIYIFPIKVVPSSQ